MTSADRRLSVGPVDSLRALEAAVDEVTAAHPGALALFRGQNNLHPTLRSGLSRPEVRYEPDVDRGFSAIAGSLLGQESLAPHNVAFRKAVLQHYGFPTHYVDLTSDLPTAAWFATNRPEGRKLIYAGVPLRFIDQKTYARRCEGIGYVLVLCVPNAEELKGERRLFDISTLEPFLRPKRQGAWLVYDRYPLLPDPNDFWLATISLDCSKFVSNLTCSHLFPLPSEDVGYKDLLSLPYVEVPHFWLEQLAKTRDEAYDKVWDVEYPYKGVWLHRDKDLVFEHQMTATRESLEVHAGHVYEFVADSILRQRARSSCKCDAPENHDARVSAMLRLSALIEVEAVILIPHPLHIPDWYFAL